MTLPQCDRPADLLSDGHISKAQQLADLANADRPALQDAWLAVFGRRPPVRLSRELLVLALSYQAQTCRSGGLAANERRELKISDPDWVAGGSAGIGRRSTVDHLRSSGRSQQQGRSEARASPRPVRRSIKPGTRLLREWQGQTYEVIAESTGRFLYRGETFRSLSAIARTITGTRWSGPTFFGIATNNQAKKAGSGDNA